MKVHDYRCEKCQRVFESFVHSDEHTVSCCGHLAKKLVSSPRFKLPGHTDDFPTAHQRWVREHEEGGRSITD